MNKKNNILETAEKIFIALLEKDYLKKDLLDKNGNFQVEEYKRLMHEVLMGIHESCLPSKKYYHHRSFKLHDQLADLSSCHEKEKYKKHKIG